MIEDYLQKEKKLAKSLKDKDNKMIENIRQRAKEAQKRIEKANERWMKRGNI